LRRYSEAENPTPAAPVDPNLVAKTMTMKKGGEELEIKYNVHVPEAGGFSRTSSHHSTQVVNRR
jgi:hypothetical protein